MIISAAALLKRQSPSLAYGHGWIAGSDGKRWHPVHDQKAFLRELSSVKLNFIQRLQLRWRKS
ncbi:phage filamentation protein Fil family protein [Erwinia aphidicola]|uniref:phage filamentation protein Fil family protein n=1 Tax=Erwinia aphidicola TaxID=68334 RepID=UPI0030160ED3